MSFEELSVLNATSMTIRLLSRQIVIYDLSYSTQRLIDFPHSHPFHEFYFILSGKARITCGTETFTLSAVNKDLLYVAPQTEHCFQTETGECELLSIAFDLSPPDNFRETVWGETAVMDFCVDDENYLMDNLIQNGTRMTGDVCGCKNEIYNLLSCVQHSYFGDSIRIFSYMTSFFILAFQNFSPVLTRDDLPDLRKELHSAKEPKAITISKYIWKHADEPIDINTLAEEFNYSKRSIQRILSDYYSVNFSTLLKHYRVAKLKSALRAQTTTLEEFAAQCGYSNPRGLSKHFQEVTGVTVMQYKKMISLSK